MNPTTQSTQQSDYPQFFLELAKEFGAGFSQEIFIFFLLAIAIYLRNQITKKIKTQLLHQNYLKKNSLNDQVKDCLIETLKLAKADRVLLLQLHNSEAFLGKFQHLKVTLTHQYVENGITSIDKIINLPLTYIQKEFDILRDEPKLQWIPKKEATLSCQKYLDSIGVELYCGQLIRNNLGVPIAIFGLHYCNHDYIPLMKFLQTTQLLKPKLKTLENLLS